MTTDKICDRCGQHVGIGTYDDNWASTPENERKPVEKICLWCAPKVSIGHVGIPSEADVQKQREADLRVGLKPRECLGREGFRTEPEAIQANKEAQEAR